MQDFPVKIIMVTSTSPIFKGSALVIVGLFALAFAYWMKKRWKEPKSFGFNIFIGLSIFIIFYGLFILIFRPDWWKLPY